MFEEEIREKYQCDIHGGVWYTRRSEKPVAILGDRWWPQAAKQEGDQTSKRFLCNTWKERNERPKMLEVSLIKNGNGATSRTECAVNDQKTKFSNK